MFRSTVVAFALAAGALACASSPQQAPAPTPQPSRAPAPVAAPAPAPAPTPAEPPATAGRAAGVYDYVASAMGEQIPGILSITFRDGVYGGVIGSSMLGDAPIGSVAVVGQKITVAADTPNGALVFEFTMTGKELAGTWNLGGNGGPVTGRKRDG